MKIRYFFTRVRNFIKWSTAEQCEKTSHFHSRKYPRSSILAEWKNLLFMKYTTLYSIGQNIEGKTCNSLGVISIKTSCHSLYLLWLQLRHWTNRYVWLDIYPWETISCDYVFYELSPMEKKLHLGKKWKWQKWMKIWFLTSDRKPMDSNNSLLISTLHVFSPEL